jgi:hypothetical protein
MAKQPAHSFLALQLGPEQLFSVCFDPFPSSAHLAVAQLDDPAQKIDKMDRSAIQSIAASSRSHKPEIESAQKTFSVKQDDFHTSDQGAPPVFLDSG